MKNFVQPGLSVLLPMPYDRTSGQGVLVGALFGVVAVDALAILFKIQDCTRFRFNLVNVKVVDSCNFV